MAPLGFHGVSKKLQGLQCAQGKGYSLASQGPRKLVVIEVDPNQHRAGESVCGFFRPHPNRWDRMSGTYLYDHQAAFPSWSKARFRSSVAEPGALER
eukprot:scaffold135_cov249-Pinguiococcus_pyrenoidosus.AAC.13